MRSETAPFWSSFLVYTGIMLIVVAIVWLAMGKVKVKRDRFVVRAEDPGSFWLWVGGFGVTGLVFLVVGVPHFGPGGLSRGT